MAVVLVSSLGMNVALLCTPSEPSSDALYLFRDDLIFRDGAFPRVGFVAAFLCKPHELPRGWLALDGQRLERLDHPKLFTALLKDAPSVFADDDGVTLPDYRGLAVFDFTQMIGLGTRGGSFGSGGSIGYLGVSLVPRAAQASNDAGGLMPITWAIRAE